jgi:subtilisin family serine protease
MFGSDVVTLPSAQSPVSLQGAQIQDPALEAVMVRWGVQELRRCFADVEPSDTLQVSRLGNIVIFPDLSRAYVLTLTQPGDVDSLVTALIAYPEVLIAERNFLVPPDQCPVVPPVACPPVAEPNDEYFRSNFNDSWHLYNCSWPDRDVSATRAWLITRGSADVTIAVVDHGIDLDHEEFQGKISGDSFIDPEWPDHGTIVASVAAANTNNACGVASLNWYARINAQSSTSAGDARNSAILDAINSGAEIINMSIGGYEYSETMHFLMAKAYKLDMILVASAGNDNRGDPHFPSRFYEALSVAATDITDDRAFFSNYGKIDVAAPGDGVIVAFPNNTYDEAGGTSVSAPLVSSLAGLLLSVDPSLCVEDVMGIIRSSADDINSGTYPGPDQFIGTGRIDARAALDRLSPPYTLRHRTATAASTVQPVGGLHMHKFWNTPGLAAGSYMVQRIEYTRNVSFGIEYVIPPEVWGLKTTEGFYPFFNVTFGVGWAEPVSGTLTRTGGTLRTYAYDVWTIGGEYAGTFPASPQDVTFDYSVLGLEDLAPPTVNVMSPNGGQTFPAESQMAIGWTVSDEYLPGVRCTLLLDLVTETGTTVWLIASNQPVVLGGVGAYNWTIPAGMPSGSTYQVRVIAYDTNNHQGVDVSDAYFAIEATGGKGGSPPPEPCIWPCPITPWEPPSYVTDLLPVSPNPFNPETRLRFTLKQADEVALRVYDVQGRLVRTIAEGFRERGPHELPWDGSDNAGRRLPSGVYFVALTADGNVMTRKLVIIR